MVVLPRTRMCAGHTYLAPFFFLVYQIQSSSHYVAMSVLFVRNGGSQPYIVRGALALVTEPSVRSFISEYFYPLSRTCPVTCFPTRAPYCQAIGYR